MRIRSLFAAAAALILGASIVICSSGCNSKTADNTSEITVNSGDILAEMTIQIGEETGKIRFKLFPEVAPKGVDNFVKLAESGYYNGKTIHRVIKDFMIQGGSLRGNGAGGTTADKQEVPRETSDRMRAYYGALGYAEDSDGINSQFFIVNNKTPFDIAKTAESIQSDLEEYAERLTDEDKKVYEDYLSKLNAVPDDVKSKYLSTGGAFSIDGNYTIFGQAIEGFEILDKISEVEVSSGNAIDDKQGIDSKPTVSITIKKIEIARIPYIEETQATTTKKSVRPAVTTAETTVQAEESPAAVDTTDNSVQPADTQAESVPADTQTDSSAVDTLTTVQSEETPAPAEE